MNYQHQDQDALELQVTSSSLQMESTGEPRRMRIVGLHDEASSTSSARSVPLHFYERVNRRILTVRRRGKAKDGSSDYSMPSVHVVDPSGRHRSVETPLDLMAIERGELTLSIHHEESDEIVSAIEDFPSDAEGSDIRPHVVEATDTANEVGLLGAAWRRVLHSLVMLSMDRVNALSLGRSLQLQLPFLTAHEAHLIRQVIAALDSGRPRNIRKVLYVAFQNRNTSRILVQNMSFSFDFVWHWAAAIAWHRIFDAWGRLPVVGITSFPATENFPSTRDHALASIFRILLGEGNWITRVVTRGREGLVTDNPNNTAQNLAAESNGFELANRNQFGTYYGRQKTNQFRLHHRLPTDESLVRTFVADPISTLTNNGVVHVIRQLDKHWNNMLYQEWGNFAHQRMEQLNPFVTLRIHLPNVLVTLASLRGRNRWDAEVLAPFVQKLQSLPSSSDTKLAQDLTSEAIEVISYPVSGGIPSILNPLRGWLQAIVKSLIQIGKDAKEIYRLLTPVEAGIRIGFDLMTQTSWRVPSDATLKREILKFIREDASAASRKGRFGTIIQRALSKTTPRDKRTLMELVRHKMHRTRPARLLLGRVKTLLQREIRRQILNDSFQNLSKGPVVEKFPSSNSWYWLQDSSTCEVYICLEYKGPKATFQHLLSGSKRSIRLGRSGVKLRSYIPVAELVSRAQKVFMQIELEYGKTFSYDAFTELTKLRAPLLNLSVVSQMSCETLDQARLNLLKEIQRTTDINLLLSELVPGENYFSLDEETRTYEPFVCPSYDEMGELQIDSESKIVKKIPQSIIVVGGGPTGLVTVMHTLENCLSTGGSLTLFEARDAFSKGGSTYERAQIVRLDARWIAIMRYHLGTGFEDVFIPASGETNAQLGNTLPTQGFVEITIKDLESILHVEVSRLWSKALISVYTDAKARYEPRVNSLVKIGKNLKVGDVVLRSGKEINRLGRKWKVVELKYAKSLSLQDLRVGNYYSVWVKDSESVLPFRLVKVNLESRHYTFQSLSSDIEDMEVSIHNMPSIYRANIRPSAHTVAEAVVFESCKTRRHEVVEVSTIASDKFILDVGDAHVIEATGKPKESSVHIRYTTEEPYAVCCMQGLKVSYGMHNFGEKRWGAGILDDLRSLNDQNTRIIGDFTKMVRVRPIAEKMYETIRSSKDWQIHFETILSSLSQPEGAFNKIVSACEWFGKESCDFHRQSLQTRFFETGDNFYLGMELPREYDVWKSTLADDILRLDQHDEVVDETHPPQCNKDLKASILHHIDRLWYHAVLETIRRGDVYNPGARHRVPMLHLINSYHEETIASLKVGESLRLSRRSSQLFEILHFRLNKAVVRSAEGTISELHRSTKVYRESNLTRGPNGEKESKVAIATFPVAHYVNHRSLRVASEKNFVNVFVGDVQASPHFMRYSGLTGAAINAMSFNNFLSATSREGSFQQRFRFYAQETDWSNGEVVQRGTGGNYGEDGFLRPGFTYEEAVAYLRAKALEFLESGQDLTHLLSRDWKTKFAATLVPRGLEFDSDFMSILEKKWKNTILTNFLETVQDIAGTESLRMHCQKKLNELNPIDRPLSIASIAKEVKEMASSESSARRKEIETHEFLSEHLVRAFQSIIEHAQQLCVSNARISSELSNQPKSVDCLVDDFAVEAQNFANSLALAAALSSCTLAFRLVDTTLSNQLSSLFAAFNIVITFATMTNVARYKIRNEEARIEFFDRRLVSIKKKMFQLLTEDHMQVILNTRNPFLIALDACVEDFRKIAKYYGHFEVTEFDELHRRFSQSRKAVEDTMRFRGGVLRLIADKYHENSYIQESLVNVAFLLSDTIEVHSSMSCSNQQGVRKLFDSCWDFEKRFERSLQRGAVRYGFVKRRHFLQWDIFAIFGRIYYCTFYVMRLGASWYAPIETCIQKLSDDIQQLSAEDHGRIFRTEIRDMQTAFWATKESNTASLIFTTAFLAFFASILFTFARIFNVQTLEDVSFWGNTISGIGALLATDHFCRKLGILRKLLAKLTTFSCSNSEDEEKLVLIKRITVTQMMFTVSRLTMVLCAAIALPWVVAIQGFGEKVKGSVEIPFWISSGAAMSALFSVVGFVIVEYFVRYNLPPNLGPFVCELFRKEIEDIYEHFEIDQLPGRLDPNRTWEYVGQEFLHLYRFDTVFAADRLGSLLQYIQSGMSERENVIAV